MPLQCGGGGVVLKPSAVGEYHSKICNVSTGQNSPEPEGACSWLEQSSLQQATDASPLSAAVPAVKEVPSCPGEHWYTSGCFGGANSFRLWCNGDSLCAWFGSLPCQAETVSRSKTTQLQHRYSVQKNKVPICFPMIIILSKSIRVGICLEGKIIFTAGEKSSSLCSIPVSLPLLGRIAVCNERHSTLLRSWVLEC